MSSHWGKDAAPVWNRRYLFWTDISCIPDMICKWNILVILPEAVVVFVPCAGDIGGVVLVLGIRVISLLVTVEAGRSVTGTVPRQHCCGSSHGTCGPGWGACCDYGTCWSYGTGAGFLGRFEKHKSQSWLKAGIFLCRRCKFSRMITKISKDI